MAEHDPGPHDFERGAEVLGVIGLHPPAAPEQDPDQDQKRQRGDPR